jgi:hypothetical protein
MKKLVSIIILTSFIAITCLSQVVIKPAIGLNFTKLSSDPLSYKQTGRLGWQIGGTLAIGKEFYLEPGIFWVKNNWQLQTLALNKLNNDISSLRIPCYVGWNVINRGDDSRNFHLFGGPAAMIVTKTDSIKGVNLGNFNRVIFGINLGAGLSINKIFVDCGYEWGLTDLYKNDDKHVKSRGFWLNAGFRLKFL